MNEELRTAVIDAIAGDGATLVEIHERTGEDSRRTLAMLHVLAGQKIVTCAREEGRGMVWCLTDEAAAHAPDATPVPPPAPTVRRIEVAPAYEYKLRSPPARRDPSRSPPRPAESNASVVLRWIAAQQRPVLVRDIIAGVGIAQQSVYNTAHRSDAIRPRRERRIAPCGPPTARRRSRGLSRRQPETRAPVEACAPQPDTVQAITRAIEKAATVPPAEIIVAPTRPALLVAVTVRVPIGQSVGKFGAAAFMLACAQQ